MANRKFSKAQKDYIKALAMYETAIELEKECKAKVLAKNIFYSEPFECGIPARSHPAERILDPRSDFEMKEADFDTYCKLCFEEYKKAGIAPEDYQKAADWPYKKTLMDAEEALIGWGWSMLRKQPQWMKVGKTLDDFRGKLKFHLEIRKQVIDLTMKLPA